LHTTGELGLIDMQLRETSMDAPTYLKNQRVKTVLHALAILVSDSR